MIPKINQKVKIIPSGEVGTITAIYPPCNEHSGRIIVYLHTKRRRNHYAEFWYSDLNHSLKIEN